MTDPTENLYRLQKKDITKAVEILADAFQDDPIWKAVFRDVPDFRNSLKIFLQYSPDDVEVRTIKTLLTQNDFIDNVHDLHLWSLDGNFTVLSCHISINKNLSVVEIEKEKSKIKKALNEIGIEHTTIEFEPNSKICNECDL